MKLMILAAKYKKKFLEDMVKHFPKDIETRLCDIGIVRTADKVYNRNLLAHDWFDRFIVSRFPNIRGWMEMHEFKPDIVYTDHITYVGWYTAFVKRFGEVSPKLVYHIRGHWFREYYRNVITSLKHLITLPLIYPLTLFGFGQCDAFVPICDWLDKDLVAKRYPSKPSFICHQGINVNNFYKDKKDVFEFKHPCVGLLQSFEIYDKVKGMIDFVEVIHNIPHIHFYICGGGFHKNKVTKAIRACPNVSFLGSLKHPDDVRKFYNSIDVFALPSGLDCCPTTILEAGLCEVPVCASRVGGIPEIIKEGKTGFLIDNVYQWESKIQLLLDDKVRTKRMGKEARKYVKANFDWAVLAPKLAEFLKGLVK